MNRGPGTIVACAGAGALVAVVVWRLGASYSADLETICHAEARSGVLLRRDMAGVADWTRAHLVTADGNAFYAGLADLPVAARARRLVAEAAARRIPSCPLVAAYDDLVDDGRFRADMQHLCSRVTFPDLMSVTAGERAEALERWIETASVTSRMRALAGPLRTAASPREQARVLNEAARGVDVLTCDVVKALLAPDPSDAAPEGSDR
jgi:hypothetical protein